MNQEPSHDLAVYLGLQGAEPCILAATPEADFFGLDEIALAELEIKLEDAKVFW